MERIDDRFLELLGDLSCVGALARHLARPVSICSCVQGLEGRLVDYAQIYVNPKGVVSTSLEGLLNTGDSLSLESSLRTGIRLAELSQSESPDMIFGRVHEVLVQGCIAGFDIRTQFLDPYSRTYDALTGHSLSLVPLNLLDLRVVAIALGVVDAQCISLLQLSRTLGFNTPVGDRAWAKSLLSLYSLNALVERFGVDAVLMYGVGEIFGALAEPENSTEGYQLSKGFSEHAGISAGEVAGSVPPATSSVFRDDSSQPELGHVQTETALVDQEVKSVTAAPVVIVPDSVAKPLDLREYILGLVDAKRVRCKFDDSILSQVETAMVQDHYDSERLLYDAQNILISALRDGDVDPLGLVNQSKVEMVRMTVGQRTNLMVKSITSAVAKNGVFLDPVEVVACLKVMEDNIE